MDFSDVQAAAPTNNGTFAAQAAFHDAVTRARQIAAKINKPGGGDAQCQGIKRPFDNDPFDEPEAKKSAVPQLTDPINALRAMADGGMDFRSPHVLQASQAAQEAAARINQQLGVSSASSLPPQPKSILPANMGFPTTEEYSIPNRMVGLVIGKGGEQITRLQTDTDCKVQIAPDSGGMEERPCTLTGTPNAIMSAKNAINKIIDKGNSATMNVDTSSIPEGQKMADIMVPGNKVGLVIGKRGETIKQMQEEARVKMVMIQDSSIPSMEDKPLRITGDASHVDKAQKMVMDLINSDNGAGPGGGGNMGGMFQGNDYGMNDRGPRGSGYEMLVPRHLVGVVIGKGGDMIKKIQLETNAKVQFKPDDGTSNDRTCSIMGPPDKVEQAASMIQELVNSANDFQFQGGPGGGMGRGMGRGRGRGRGGPFMGGPGGPGGRGMGRGGPYGGGGGGGPNFQEETVYTVPADKCGIVIGKGGETIKDINRQCGGHVELQRTPGPNPNQKHFTVRGSREQIQHAFQLIAEKVGESAGPGGPPGGPGGPGSQGSGGPSSSGGFDQYGQPQQPPSPQSYGGQGGWQQNQFQQYPQYQGQQGGGPADPSKQAADNAAAWAAYYAQYYSQYGQYGGQYGQNQQQQQQQAPQTPQQQAPQAQQPQPQQQGGQAYPSPGTAINPQTGQPDFSAAWVEYYRQQGMHMQANMILLQAGQGGQAGQQGQIPQQ